MLFGSLYFWGGVAFALMHGHRAGPSSLLLAFIIVEFLTNQSKYFLNDVRDAGSDREHPRKDNRAVAAGAISRRTACLVGAARVLVASGLSAAFAPILLPTVALVLATQFAYDRLAKPIPLFNAAVLSLSCVWRFGAGYAALAGTWPAVGVCALIYLQRISIYINSYSAEGRYLARFGRIAAKPPTLFYARHPLIAKLSFLPFLASGVAYILRAGIPSFPAIGAIILLVGITYYRVNGPGDRPYVAPARYARLLPRLALRTARLSARRCQAGLMALRAGLAAHLYLGVRRVKPNLQEVK